jgi:glycosyltransferase involved in cell wall biosynthesis
VDVIPDGIDLDKFRPMDKASARANLGVAADKPCILFTSVVQNNPVKRKELADAAFEVVKRKYPNVQILIPENVDHSRMPYFVNASDVVLSTSTHEGWPNCIKEALACNVPFVATDVSDLKEVASRNPICKIADADPEKLGAAMIEVLDDATRANHNLRLEVESMELSRCATAIKSVYEALLKA